MNSCEKMQIARMNLRPGRGRDLSHLTRLALQTLRQRRQFMPEPYALEDLNRIPTLYEVKYGTLDTLKKARFHQLRARQLYGLELAVVDSRTRIRLI